MLQEVEDGGDTTFSFECQNVLTVQFVVQRGVRTVKQRVDDLIRFD